MQDDYLAKISVLQYMYREPFINSYISERLSICTLILNNSHWLINSERILFLTVQYRSFVKVLLQIYEAETTRNPSF